MRDPLLDNSLTISRDANSRTLTSTAKASSVGLSVRLTPNDETPGEHGASLTGGLAFVGGHYRLSIPLIR